MEATSLLRAVRSKIASFPRLVQRVRCFSSTAIVEQFYSSDKYSYNGSPVYPHTLKFQPPPTLTWEGKDWRNSAKMDLWNSASFIGTVDHPIQRVNSTNVNGAYTLLNVKSPRSSKPDFWIKLKMWNQMAEISFKHLRPNDFICVSGQLSQYNVTNKNGEQKTYYELNVKEINYVQSRKKDEPDAEKHEHQLRLWQSFFTYPCDWWDNRLTKWHREEADFKHKYTGEVLAISSEDPPWIKRQLELHDSGLIGNAREASTMMFSDFGQG